MATEIILERHECNERLKELQAALDAMTRTLMDKEREVARLLEENAQLKDYVDLLRRIIYVQMTAQRDIQWNFSEANLTTECDGRAIVELHGTWTVVNPARNEESEK